MQGILLRDIDSPLQPDTVGAPQPVEAPTSISAPKCFSFWGRVYHQWTLLEPATEELVEIRRLVSFSRSGDLGANPTTIFDRVCPKCGAHERRMALYIEALRRVRGEV